LEAIQIIKKLGGNLNDSYLEEGNKFTKLPYKGKSLTGKTLTN